ncbi:MAG: hypothetical protein K0B06_00980 [Brevefilum sp.]|nr:hypothetical protein [Brevefilum sp.]
MTNQTIDSHTGLSRWAHRLSLLIFCLIILSACNLPSSLRSNSAFSDNISDLATPPVNIQFQLELPEPVTDELNIVVEILDDVTGLLHNNKLIGMEKQTDQIYQTTLSVPSGSIIKYRYGKVEDTLTPEILPGGEPVLYRLYHAQNNSTVSDILHTWQGDIFHGGTGKIIGTLLDNKSNQPIPDILVVAGGRRTFTDANGKYLIDGLGSGVHNIVFYAIDGQFRTYQQGALVEPGMTTPADVKLQPLPKVSVTFQVIPPNDALGAPIYMAGNLVQLGNTFADLNGSMSVKPKRMPTLTPNADGTQSITLQLYQGTDLRYKFTLGDGYWNAEQNEAGGFRIRQLIVPSEDVTIDHTIRTWRTAGLEPITFSVSIPPETSPVDGKYIQFKAREWTEPIPLWPLGNGNYLHILFSPLDSTEPIPYRFCQNEDCVQASDMGSLSFERQIEPSQNPQTINLTLDSWQNWHVFEKNASVQEAYTPTKPASYGTYIEFTPEMDPSWLALFPQGIAQLDQINASRVIFSPQWFVKGNSPYLYPLIGQTPFLYELSMLLQIAESQGFELSLYPQLGPYDAIENWWPSAPKTELWWDAFFTSYADFIISYAKLAQQSGVDQLIVGGKALLPTFEGGLLPDGSDSSAHYDDRWNTLIDEIRTHYNGQLIWGTNTNLEMDPLPEFINRFDGIYISVDSPLALGDHPSFEMVQAGFIDVIDSQIYEIYRSTLKPITLALGYPSVENAASGCALLGASCYNDGLFRSSELTPYAIDFEEQALIYNAVMPIIASREWITAVSIRGYEPIVTVQTGSSSIAAKPAFDVIQYWFTNMKP